MKVLIHTGKKKTAKTPTFCTQRKKIGNSESLSRLLRKLPIFEMASQSRGKPARLVVEPRFPFVYHSRSPPPPPKGTTGSTKNSTRKMATVSCRRVEDLNATDQIDWNCEIMPARFELRRLLNMASFQFY